MNKLSHVCGLLLFVLLANTSFSYQLSAQDNVVIYVESVETTIDEEIAVNIAADNFINVGGLQISMQWDPAQLEYLGVDNLAFNATPQSSLNVSQLDDGRLGFFAADMTLEGFDLDNGSTLLTMRFNAVGQDNSVYDLGFVDEPLTRVVADTLSTPFPVDYIDGTITIGTPSSVGGAFVSDPRVRISPNPFQDQAQVLVQELGSGPAQLSVFDIDGRLVINRSISLNGQLQSFSIEAEDLQKTGVYLLQISTDRGKYSRKLVFRGNGR